MPNQTMVRIQLLILFLFSALFLGACQTEGEPTPTSTPTPTIVSSGIEVAAGVEEVAAVVDSSTETPLPTQPTLEPQTAEQIAIALSATPVPIPDGESIVIRPAAGGDVGWWSNQEIQGHIGDSFLYAGSADGQNFLAAFRMSLERVPRSAVIRAATLTLYGLRDDRLARGGAGTWTVQFIEPFTIDNFVQSDFQELFNAPAIVTLLPELQATDLGRGVVNQWSLDSSSRVRLAFLLAADQTEFVVRIIGPTDGQSNLFAWDSGIGATSEGDRPALELVLGPAPADGIRLPTSTPVVATLTPTPANLLTRAAESMTATSIASTIGTYTPTPENIATPTPLAANIATAEAIAFVQGLPPIVVYTSTPANNATATANALYATAAALTTGTSTPVPADAVTPVIVTPTPQPDNILTSVAQLLTPPPSLTTPLPYNAIVATPTPEPMVVTNTPTPLNAATSVAYSQYATAVAILTGTFTPTPSYIVTATPVPVLLQRLPLIQYLDLLPPTPTAAVPTPPPSRMPTELIGRILFLSNREGGEGVYMVDPATGRLARINERWPYDLAKEAEQKSPDGQLVSIVREDNRRIPQIYVFSAQYNSYRQITTTSGWSYDPAWSPTGEWIAFVSQETGNDEIFIIRPDGSETRQLTKNTWEWDKHVSWSPDGQEIVFWSNRDTGRAQLWVMNSDGSNQRKLLDSPYEDREPVWVK